MSAGDELLKKKTHHVSDFCDSFGSTHIAIELYESTTFVYGQTESHPSAHHRSVYSVGWQLAMR